jgi:hypothetical protein
MGQENRNIDNGTIIGTVPLLDQYYKWFNLDRIESCRHSTDQCE